MNQNNLLDLSIQKNSVSNKLNTVEITKSFGLQVYPLSVNTIDDGVVFIAKIEAEKFLFILLNRNSANSLWNKLIGEEIPLDQETNLLRLKKCKLIHDNSIVIQETFHFTRPQIIGLTNSIGMGDRLGLANPGHLRSLRGYHFKPILAQQSIRELTRTQRTPEEVMDAAVWSVLQEGYKEGFGSDADHLKTTDDIDLLMKAGFTMYTFDPSEYVNNKADSADENELNKIISTINWDGLKTKFENLLADYNGKHFIISKDFSIQPTEIEIKRAVVKYSNAIAHINRLYEHIKSKYSGYQFEVEVSVDETESVTTPFEHFFIANELKRLKVEFVSLAPRFVGDFEKGIDYKGDVNLFRREYLKHLAVAKYFGTYKISLHSGSDKFTVYKIIGSLKDAHTHVKTAGTSYLEALKVVASREPTLFKEILDFSRGLYDTEKKSYHVTADLTKVRSGADYADSELPRLFDSNDVRQVLHVTFGKVLSDKTPDGFFLFKNRIVDCLKQNEELHYEFIEKHFRKHLEPFAKN
ncbi:MAG: tagaturonate epimerase family protein [Bacteroidetes bacterium]|nr:tagaturonate epimerase family protein [Bacteroidota bacterium]MCL6100436.1 tagaturonate epimerase family protein [Bacteroidota bacterium]